MKSLPHMYLTPTSCSSICVLPLSSLSVSSQSAAQPSLAMIRLPASAIGLGLADLQDFDARRKHQCRLKVRVTEAQSSLGASKTREFLKMVQHEVGISSSEQPYPDRQAVHYEESVGSYAVEKCGDLNVSTSLAHSGDATEEGEDAVDELTASGDLQVSPALENSSRQAQGTSPSKDDFHFGMFRHHFA